MIAALIAGGILLGAIGLLIWLAEHAPIVEDEEELTDGEMAQVGIGSDALTADDRLVLHRGVEARTGDE